MIISLGILSILQLTLVPGLILAKAFKIHGFWENLIAAIGLSQLFNYAFVIITTLLKIYTQTTTLILFGLEVVLVIVLYFPNINWNLGKIISTTSISTFFKEYTNKITTTIEWKKKVLTYLYYIIFSIAVFYLCKNIYLYVLQIDHIFTSWDAVVSWDNWAMQWYSGTLPVNTEHYPQLWSTNLSISYQFIGTTVVKYFSKYFASLIDFFIILLVFILGIKKKNVGYFLGVFFTSWLMFAFGSKGSGYADSPVAFWALMAFSCLLLAEESKDEQKLLLLGAFFISGAALTKQAGLWMVIMYPILVAMRSSNNTKKSFSLIIQIILIMLIMVAPWYIFKEIQIRNGIESSEIERVTSLVLNKQSIVIIFTSAQNLFQNTIKNPYFSKQVTQIILLLLMLFSFKEKFWQRICGFVIIPFWIGWIFFFSYENRNLDMIIPLLAISAGVGFSNILTIDWSKLRAFIQQKAAMPVVKLTIRIMKWIYKFVTSLKLWYLIILIPLIFTFPYWFTDNQLISKSLIRQRYIGDAFINQQMYDYEEKYGIDGKIVTSYPFLGFLPELGQYCIYNTSRTSSFFEIFNDPNTSYALLNNHWWSSEVHDYIFKLIEDNKIQVLFEVDTPAQNGKYYFVTTCHGVCK
jgi:hypothetical protein